MKVFIGGELEHSISDKFRKARNSVIDWNKKYSQLFPMRIVA